MFKQKIIVYKHLSSFKIMGSINKDVNIKL